MSVYSHSKLGAFEGCPYKFKLRYVDRISRRTQGIEAFMGSCVHEALEELYRAVGFAKVPLLDEVCRVYESVWDRDWNDEVKIVREGLEAGDYRRKGRRCVEDYYRRYTPFDQGKTLGLEERILIDLAGGRYQLQGYIDRLAQVSDGHYEIHDYKSSNSLPAQAEADADRQLALYQIGIQRRWNDVDKVDLVWHYVVFDKEIRSTRTPEQLEQLESEVVAEIEKVEAAVRAGRFPTNESRLCDWCEYPDLCPARRHLHVVAALPVNEYMDEPGVALVDKFAELEAERQRVKASLEEVEGELDALKEAVSAHAAREGLEMLFGTDHRLKVKISKRRNFPRKGAPGRDELDSLLKEAGTWIDVSDLSTSKLSKLLDSGALDRHLVELIEEYQAVEEKLSVTLAKLREEEKVILD